jgi:hypothetical protein
METEDDRVLIRGERKSEGLREGKREVISPKIRGLSFAFLVLVGDLCPRDRVRKKGRVWGKGIGEA